jgi:Flp pilus assembly protein CpaB
MRRRRPAAPVVEAEPTTEVSGQPVLRRRTPLPNGRAVAGGLLVAVAGLGVAAAHLSAAPDAGVPYVVVTEAIAPGDLVHADQLATARMDLPAEVARGAFRDPARLDGVVALDPLGAGEMVQAGDVLAADGGAEGPARPELSVALERERAVDGRLVPGDVVDLLATYGTGDGGSTQPVARGATVRATTTDGDGGFAGGSLVTITLALADEGELLAATHAAREDALTLVRSTGTAGTPEAAYRPGDLERPTAEVDDAEQGS